MRKFSIFLNKMQKLMHFSKIRVIVLWVLCALFMITNTTTASELSGKTHFERSSWLWTFSFNVVAKIDSSGTVQLYIKDVKKAHRQAWASMHIQAKITKIKHNFGDRIIYIKVTFQGTSNHFSESLETGKVIWGPPTEVAHETWTDRGIYIHVPQGYQLPENLEPGPPADYSYQSPQSEQPESNDPCNPENRISKSVPATREEFTNKTYVKFKKGHTRIKIVGCNKWMGLQDGMELKPGDIVQTLVDGRAIIVLSGSSFVRVKPNTTMIIPKKENTSEKVSLLKLVWGVLWVHAKKEKNMLKVATPQAVCGVRGTEFEVSYINGKSCVKALKHSVWFSDIGKKHVVVVPEGMMSCMTDQDIKPSSPAPITGNIDENISMLNIAGIWNTNWGQMILKQHGKYISGTYTYDKGKLEGVLKGRVLTGKWMEAPTYKPCNDSGAIKFTFSLDGKSFTGHWRYGFKGNSWSGEWRGTFIGK